MTTHPHGLDRVALTAALLAVGSVVLSTLSPGILTGSELLGAGTADTWGHAWGYGWTADALAAGSVPFDHAPVDHPGSQRWWVIDLPVAILLAPITGLAGSALAYNLAVLGHLALGAAAVTALVRARGGGDAIAVAAGVCVVHAPFVRGVVASGVPEALGVLIAPLLVLWLDVGLRSGQARPLVGAAFVSVVLVLDGVYGALAGAWAAAVATGAAVLGTRERVRVALRAGMVALPAGVAMAGLRLALHASEHPALYAAKQRTVRIGEAWVLQPLGGSDLAAWSTPVWWLPHIAPDSPHRHIVYVGVLLPLMMVWAAWRHPVARRPVLVAGVGALLALGPALFVHGEPYTSAILPGTWLWVAGATNLYRLAGLVPVLGMVAVVTALSRAGRPPLVWGALVAVMVEWTVGAPVSMRMPTVPNPAGAVEAFLAHDPTPGAVLDLPFDREGSRARGPFAQRTFFLASVHGRAVASGLYKQATMQTRNPTLGEASRAFRVSWMRQQVPDGSGAPARPVALRSPLSPHAGALLVAHLEREGFSHVTLDLELLVPAQRPDALAWAESWLGPPHATSADGLRLAWRLEDAASRSTEPIDLPPPPEAPREAIP